MPSLKVLSRCRFAIVAALVVAAVSSLAVSSPADAATPIDYAARVEPIFKRFCFDCHVGEGAEAEIALDQLTIALRPADDHHAWLAVWKNLRAQTMPPSDADQPTDAERDLAIAWIEQAVFQLDPLRPDPGRVTVRRLNRVEYANTIRDLLDVQFNVFDAFPADDTGYGFDTIGDVLTISPLLMEKYVEAAEQIVAKALPGDVGFIPTITIYGDSLRDPKNSSKRAKSMPFAEPVTVVRQEKVAHAGPYRIEVEMDVTGSEEASSHTANLILKLNGKALAEKGLGWDNREKIVLSAETSLAAGEPTLSLQLVPEDPPEKGEKKLTVNVKKVTLRGPLDGSYKEYPPQYRKVFFDGPPPDDATARETYLRKILNYFAERAFRRPVDAAMLDRLTTLAQGAEHGPKGSFERAVALGLTVILSSPRFLFRVETDAPSGGNDPAAPIDEFALASRLSYLLWSTMPDDELYGLAKAGRLRAELRAQVDRLIEDPRSNEFIRNFVGQADPRRANRGRRRPSSAGIEG
jgi:mono/diheme cytochrome c family protein